MTRRMMRWYACVSNIGWDRGAQPAAMPDQYREGSLDHPSHRPRRGGSSKSMAMPCCRQMLESRIDLLRNRKPSICWRRCVSAWITKIRPDVRLPDMIYIKDGSVARQDKGCHPESWFTAMAPVASEEAVMITLRWRCSADLPTRQAVQMARDALRRGFALPETVSHPAIDSQVMSLAYLLMAYGLVPEPRGPDDRQTSSPQTQGPAAGLRRQHSLLRCTGGNGDGAGNGYDMRDRSVLVAGETPPGQIHMLCGTTPSQSTC